MTRSTRTLWGWLCICAGVAGGILHAQARLVTANDFPFAPAAGQEGSSAVSKDAPTIQGWAATVLDYQPGTAVAAEWQTPLRALGPAEGTAMEIVSLGRGGSIIIAFDRPLADGPGPDFAVFENSINDNFLELAWVAVSSDGVHFLPFPHYALTASPVGGFGHVDPTFIFGLAGKYRQGFGTPFDLTQLRLAAEAIANGTSSFSADFVQRFNAALPFLDWSQIRYIGLIDIVGDGTALDSDGFVIYDPYPTVGSAGFDLDAVAMLHAQGTWEGLADLRLSFCGSLNTGWELELSSTTPAHALPNWSLEAASLSFDWQAQAFGEGFGQTEAPTRRIEVIEPPLAKPRFWRALQWPDMAQ